MGLFDSIRKTRELGANIIEVRQLTERIGRELGTLALELDNKQGIAGGYEYTLIVNIGYNMNRLMQYSEKLGNHFATLSVNINGQNTYLPGAILFFLRVISEIEERTGATFGVKV